MATPEAIFTMVGLLAEAFRQTPSEATFLAYEFGLDDIDDSTLKASVRHAMRTCKFMPTVSELREISSGGKSSDRAVLAWGAVLQAVPVGAYKHVDFDDGCINATIRNMGGWPTFLERFTDAEAEKWTRKEFCDTYAHLASCGVDGDVCRPLAGLSAGQVINGVLGQPVPLRIETGLPANNQPRLTND